MAESSKPSETSAASTAFCSFELEGPQGYLWIDGNGKITAGNGSLDDPHPNAFSLVEIEDCPGSTAVCRVACYVHGLKKHAPGTHALYVHNSTMIRKILEDDTLTLFWATTMARHIEQHCGGGFRWHVSGDVFSLKYAEFIASVVRDSPNVLHWIYTRSFDNIAPLLSVCTALEKGNLVLNLSCDSENYARAIELSAAHGLRLCYLTTDGSLPVKLDRADVIFPDYSLRGGTPEGQAWFASLAPAYKRLVCPVDYHGKSEQRRCGPCNRCMT